MLLERALLCIAIGKALQCANFSGRDGSSPLWKRVEWPLPRPTSDAAYAPPRIASHIGLFAAHSR